MAQGNFKLSKGGDRSTKGGSRPKHQVKKGARVIKPKKSRAVEGHVFKKKLQSEHIRKAEEQSIANLSCKSLLVRLVSRLSNKRVLCAYVDVI